MSKTRLSSFAGYFIEVVEYVRRPDQCYTFIIYTAGVNDG